jgi:hypothetical protein
LSNPWFRFYASVVNDPKVQRLEPRLFKTWVNILCVASENDGLIPDIADLSFVLRMTEEDLGADFEALVGAGLIDEFENHVTPHNWNGRQFQSDVSTDRVKRFRDKKRNASETPTETPPDQIRTEADTDKTSSLRSEGARKRASRLPEDFEPDLSIAISLGLTRERAEAEASKFKDHFTAAPGQRGVKNDWPATWRNWCRRAIETEPRHGRNSQPSGSKSRPHDAIFRALAEQAEAGNGVNQREARPDERDGADRAGKGADPGPIIDLEAAAFRRAV